jgi:hypothetical protein
MHFTEDLLLSSNQLQLLKKQSTTKDSSAVKISLPQLMKIKQRNLKRKTLIVKVIFKIRARIFSMKIKADPREAINRMTDNTQGELPKEKGQNNLPQKTTQEIKN